MASTALPIIWRESPYYEEARVGRVFNHRRPERFPDGVVEATSVQDVVQAVQLAKKMKLRVSVRSGGHSWAAWSVRDNALLVDLGKLNCLELDEARSVIKCSPSTTGRILNRYLATKGKMFAGGHCPDVGLGGFLLQGGMGWNCKNWGWACEKVVAIEVVTSNAEVIQCSKNENEDLFWAARGAGPGFPGIITAFHLEIRDSFSSVMSSTFQWPLSEYKTVMDWTIKVSQKLDDSIEAVALSIRPDPKGEAIFMSHFITFQNTEAEAAASLKLVNDTHPPGCIMESMCKPTSLEAECVSQDIANPAGHRYTAENAYIDNDADVTEVLEAAFNTMPEGSKTFALWYAMYPCSRRKLPDMALSMQSDHYFALYTVWEERKDDDRCNEWVKNVMSDVEKHSVGAYLGDSDFQVRQTKFWQDSEAARLMDVRRKWDSEGLICGYLNEGDTSGTEGLQNLHSWQIKSS